MQIVPNTNHWPTISAPLEGAKLRVLSYGGGVESTTLLLMAKAGLWGPMPDVAIMADTDDETEAALEQVRWVQSPNVGLPFPVHVVQVGSLSEDLDAVTSGRKKRMANPPFFLRNADGSRGRLTRGCTRDYKINAVRKEIKRLLGLKPRARLPKQPIVEQVIGIAFDDLGRMAPSHLPHIYNRHPLIEMEMTRTHCLEWTWEQYRIDLEPSGCKRCPFRDDFEWHRMKTRRPHEFAEACRSDLAIRRGIPGVRGEAFIHDSLRPLAEINFDPTEDRQGIFDICSGEGACRL